MIWEILIPHIPHRHAQLLRLLGVLEPQMRPEVGVVIYADNLEADYPTKLQRLTESSTAEYISGLSNDDSVSPDFIVSVLAALLLRPDYVGFRVRYTENGVVQEPVIHSLSAGGWYSDDGVIYRDLMHYNPIRRELAMRVKFHGDPYLADRIWAGDLRELDCVKNEIFIDREMYYYQHSSADDFVTRRVPFPEPLPELPQRSWIRYVDA